MGLVTNIEQWTMDNARCYLEEEGLSMDDAEFVFAFKDRSNKSTIYFEVKEHKGEHEYYMVIYRKEKCHLSYR